MRRTLLVVALLALLAPFAVAATADAPADAPAADLPTAGAEEDGTEPPPAAEGDSAEAEPFLDLETPKPHHVCKAGWCSSNAQCVQWYGEGSTCDLEPGATCGHCVF